MGHDVFISFRGEDTRRGFTSHLHTALRQASIDTYTDDYLSRGHNVWPELCRAIENSYIAIIIFSRNYATSKWCLKELVKILECRKTKKQVVIPVFYKVDPSHVRNQTQCYGEAFARHERDFFEKGNEYVRKQVAEWRDALSEAANISGWDSDNRDHKDESQLIKKIVNDVTDKHIYKFPFSRKELEAKDRVGISKICEDVKSLLSRNQKKNSLLKNGHVIGIWGMGGIGKTTIAKVVFSQIFSQYDNVCFLSNVKEESQRLRLPLLHDRFLSELLKNENLKSNSTFIKRKLSSKKVFIVLDDVDSVDQLDELCRECEDAASGSILIITTRDKRLLRARVDEDAIYEVNTWNFKQSLELFSLHAFDTMHPPQGYEDLSKRAVEYVQGVPLALKVLGSHLSLLSIELWDEELEKLKSYPHDSIQNVLQISYDGLPHLEKKIFLDIAFFFKDENKDYVERILSACGFYASTGIKSLEDKALVTISRSKRIQMHDLTQVMGLNIVRQDNEDPGKRSRLRDIEEVSDVLENLKGCDAVEGIKLDLSEIDDLHLNADAFNMMSNLRFLILYVPSGKTSGKVNYPRVFNKFPAKLRYLEWYGYHLKSLPPTFNAKMLVEIRMPHSHIVELWWEVKDVPNLEGIDLTECKLLKRLPDLSKAKKLRWVNLSGCESLCDVHPSILALDTLETLILDDCKTLKSLKSEHLKSLQHISVQGCISLKKFSVSSVSMKKLDLRNSGIDTLDSSIGRISKLEWLNIEGLRLKDIPSEIYLLRYLEDLRISNCIVVIDREKLQVLFGGLRSLRKLHLKDCCNLFELPDNINSLTHLFELKLDGSNVETLPESIRDLLNLEILSLKSCMKLQCLPELPPNIKEFNAVNCSSLVTVSTLNTFAKHMMGKDKFISFQNCMKLDGSSLHHIMEGAYLTMRKATIENVSVRTYGLTIHSYNYTSIKDCFPSSEVPEQLTYQKKGSSIAIKLPSGSNFLGIILSVVLSPSEEMNMQGAKIFCQCYMADGTKLGHATAWYHKAIPDFNSDHVFMWYDAFHFDSIVKSKEAQVSFVFSVTIRNDKGERDVFNTNIKQCGVGLMFHPDSQQSATLTKPETSDNNRSCGIKRRFSSCDG